MSELKKHNLMIGLQMEVISILDFFSNGGEISWFSEGRL